MPSDQAALQLLAPAVPPALVPELVDRLGGPALIRRLGAAGPLPNARPARHLFAPLLRRAHPADLSAMARNPELSRAQLLTLAKQVNRTAAEQHSESEPAAPPDAASDLAAAALDTYLHVGVVAQVRHLLAAGPLGRAVAAGIPSWLPAHFRAPFLDVPPISSPELLRLILEAPDEVRSLLHLPREESGAPYPGELLDPKLSARLPMPARQGLMAGHVTLPQSLLHRFLDHSDIPADPVMIRRVAETAVRRMRLPAGELARHTRPARSLPHLVTTPELQTWSPAAGLRDDTRSAVRELLGHWAPSDYLALADALRLALRPHSAEALVAAARLSPCHDGNLHELLADAEYLDPGRPDAAREPDLDLLHLLLRHADRDTARAAVAVLGAEEAKEIARRSAGWLWINRHLAAEAAYDGEPLGVLEAVAAVRRDGAVRGGLLELAADSVRLAGGRLRHGQCPPIVPMLARHGIPGAAEYAAEFGIDGEPDPELVEHRELEQDELIRRQVSASIWQTCAPPLAALADSLAHDRPEWSMYNAAIDGIRKSLADCGTDGWVIAVRLLGDFPGTIGQWLDTVHASSRRFE
jgi:hypothetical protein